MSDAKRNAEAHLQDIVKILTRIDGEETGDEELDGLSSDEAIERAYEIPLSVEFRSGWTLPGHKMEAEEYCVLLTTGGPACRIIGELNRFGEPETAEIQCQDWATPWTEFVPMTTCDGDEIVDTAKLDSLLDSLLKFARLVVTS